MKSLEEMKEIMIYFINAEHKAIKDDIIWIDFQICLNDKLIALIKGYFKDGLIDKDIMKILVEEINLRGKALICLELIRSERKHLLEEKHP
jgi:hypothetical protein